MTTATETMNEKIIILTNNFDESFKFTYGPSLSLSLSYETGTIITNRLPKCQQKLQAHVFADGVGIETKINKNLKIIQK